MTKTEKSGVTVMVVGKRVIIWDAKANKLGEISINGYVWQRKGNYGTAIII